MECPCYKFINYHSIFMRKIVLADNQDITKLGIQFLLKTVCPDNETIEFTDKRELIDYIQQNPTCVVILDYTLFDFESVNDLQILQQRFEQVDWVLFSDELSTEFLQQLLFNTHSFSVVLKDAVKEEIVTALKDALTRKRFICSTVSNLLIDNQRGRTQQPTKPLLTTTEQEILKEISLGKTTKEIANLRFLSVHTIMTHRKNIFRKINVNNVHEATKYAMRAGIVDFAEYYI